MMAGYLIINIRDIYLITPANSACIGRKVKQLRSFYFLVSHLGFHAIEKNAQHLHNLAYIRFEISTLKLTRIH